jgi:hypothetical protein
MSTLKPPALLNDLYRDLRDRRLLIPAVALVAALIAVPVLLSTDSPPAPPPAPPPPSEATAAQPAVLAQTVGIRDYRKRLEALKSKNPFKQKFALPTPESVALADQGSTTAAGTPAASTVAGDTSTASSSGSTSTSTQPVEPVSGGGTGPARVRVEQTTKLITRRIDVAVGPLGETKQVKNVRALDFLPSNDAPIVAFLGVSEDAKRASFAVSADVVFSDGDGSCVPDPCQFLTLKRGGQRYLHYRPEGEPEEIIYRLRLLRVRDKVVKAQ